MRKHPLPEAPLEAKAELFSPGNDAWIIRQNGRMFVTESRTCEGFAPLDQAPEDGLGVPVGVYELRNDVLIFTAAPKVELPLPVVAEPAVEPTAEAPASVPEAATKPVPAKN